jgi:adenylate cyclase class 2
MSDGLEREIKLRFPTADEARAAVLAAGAKPSHGRRLQDDRLLDTADMMLRQQRSVLRVRQEPGRSLLTFKGPGQAAAVKVREELETVVGDGPLLLSVFERLGFRPSFRYQKYREEFELERCIVAVDETPVGTFVEIEGDEQGIAAIAAALGRGPADYVLDSYYSLYRADCERRGVPVTNMVFT